MHSIKFISKRFDCPFCIMRIPHLQSIVKSFGVQSNLSFHQKASFIMMTPIEIDNKVKDEIELAKTFNSHYKHPTTLGTLARIVREREIVKLSFKNHWSILSINKRCRGSKNPHKMSLERYVRNRSTPFSVTFFVWWLMFPWSGKQ